jgi:GTP-binding protein EngB required for normal cell division
MIADKNGYAKIQQEVFEYSNILVSKDEQDSFNDHINAKLADFNPSIMVYGTYNAGKSTLLNALFGQEEMAKTGDSPETSEIHGYEHNGFTIYDTPGINAPQEHEEVTKEHLDKSEIIIFVLSNDGSLEEEYIYDKISEIVKANKPIIIVLNNKKGTDLNSQEAIEEINKVNINLSKIGDRNDIDKIENKVKLCMVNAKTALKGKVESKNLLLQKSNIIQLETMIEEVLEKSGTKEVINALNGYIYKFIERVIDRIDHKIDTKEIQKTEELITYLEKYKQSSDVKLKNTVSKQMPILADGLTSMLLSESTSGETINAFIDESINKTIQQIESEIRIVESNIQTKIGEFSIEFAAINPDYTRINMTNSDNETTESSPLIDEMKNKASAILKNQNVAKEGVEAILNAAKKWLPDVMKGKGPVWMGKAAGKAAIALNVAMSAYETYSAYKEHEDAIQRQREHVLSTKTSAQSIANDIQTSLFASVDEIVTNIFNDLILNYRNASKKLSGNNESLVADKDGLLSIINKL